ncbi:MAG: helix-turn-helix transcriptional regulator [Actinobacteria bacterium]|nr:helix-turn-helix transcriptional regulator [Actinomycetota bacterium]
MGSEKQSDMKLQIDHREKLKLRPSYLAFIAFASTFMLYSPNLSIFQESSTGTAIIGYFVFAMFGSCMVMGFVFVFYALKHPLWQNPEPLLLTLGVALYILGSLTFFFLLQMDKPLPYIAMIAGICTGLGSVPVCVAWGCHLSTMGLKSAVFFVAIVCGSASLLSWSMTIIPTVALYIIFPFLLLMGSLTPLVKTITRTLDLPKADSTFNESPTAEPHKLLPSLRKLASVVWLPAMGLLLYTFMMSVRKYQLFNSFESEFFGGIIAAVCIVPLCFFRSDKPLLSFVYKAIVPVSASVIIILNSFPVESMAQSAGTVCLYVFLAFLAVFALASLIGITNAGEFTPPLLFGVALFLGALVSCIGVGLANLFPTFEDYDTVLLVMTSMFFSVILISLGFETWSLLSKKQATPLASSLQDTLEARCETLSQRRKLSKRESEILCYMGRGHSPVYIAKTLLISESTARSHVRNIYRKVGVSSREELLQLIDEEPAR